MKFVKTAIATSLLAFVMTISAQAQTLQASVPFKFVAGDQVMPAGDYNMRVDFAHHRLTVTDHKGAVMAFIPLMTRTHFASDGKAVLVFNTYGTAHFLATVQGSGDAEGWSLFPSRGERELAKKVVRSTTQIALAR